MVTCSNCRARQLDGTLFCTECGASMLEIRSAEPASRAPATVGATGALRLTLVVVGSGRRLALDLSDDLLIGRRDEPRGILPDVDLGRDGGFDAGVSRRHAILFAKRESCFVEDLNSANGTYVNGRRLDPQTPAELRHGDELRCGSLALRVEIA